MTERLPEREGVPLPYGPLWVDWSGISAVWVCEVCGAQGAGGFTIAQGRSEAFKHWRDHHPERAGLQPVTRQPPCAWGMHWVGVLRGESCEGEPRTNGLCSKHAAADKAIEERGMCSWDDCVETSVASQPNGLCRRHCSIWATQKGYAPLQVVQGHRRYPSGEWVDDPKGDLEKKPGIRPGNISLDAPVCTEEGCPRRTRGGPLCARHLKEAS